MSDPRGLWLVLGIVGMAMLSLLADPEPRPRTLIAPTPTPSVPLSTYQTIREFDDVTLISAEQYRQMFRIYAQQCGTTEQDAVSAVQPVIDLYRAEGVRPEGHLAQYVGIAAQRLDERGDISCQAFLGASLMAGVVDAQAGR